MGDRRLSPAYFKADEPLVATRAMTVVGVEVKPGGDIPQDLDLGIRRRLWQSTRAVYKKDFKPTAVETPDAELERLVTIDGPLPGGYYNINVPWSAEPERVRGQVPAQRRREAIIAYGDPKGVIVTEARGGWYHIHAEWLEEVEKVQGQAEAEARASELRAEGPPAGFDPAIAELVSSGEFEAVYTFGGDEVPLADLITAAQASSGHDPAQWEDLTDEDRTSLIRREIDGRNEALERAAAEPAKAAEGGSAPADSEEQTAEGNGIEKTPVPAPADGSESTLVADDAAGDFAAEETGSNGNYTITGPGLKEPLKFRGTAEALEEKLVELRAGQAKAAETPADEA